MENSETQTELIPDAEPKRRRPFPWRLVLLLLLVALDAVLAASRGGNLDPNPLPPAPSPTPGPILAEAVFEEKLPEWFPGENWYMDFLNTEGPVYLVKYKAPDVFGKKIYYVDSPTGGSVLTIDTEDAEILTDLRVHGYDAMMSVKESHVILVWVDTERDRLCDLELHEPPPDFTPEMLLRIAEGLYEVEIPLPAGPVPKALDVEEVFREKLPGWFPGESWREVYQSLERVIYLLEFKDPHGNRIGYTRMPAAGNKLHLDIENVENHAGIPVHGYLAVMLVKEGQIILAWYDEDRGTLCALELDGPHPGFTQEMLLEMAESLYSGD